MKHKIAATIVIEFEADENYESARERVKALLRNCDLRSERQARITQFFVCIPSKRLIAAIRKQTQTHGEEVLTVNIPPRARPRPSAPDN